MSDGRLRNRIKPQSDGRIDTEIRTRGVSLGEKEVEEVVYTICCEISFPIVSELPSFNNQQIMMPPTNDSILIAFLTPDVSRWSLPNIQQVPIMEIFIFILNKL